MTHYDDPGRAPRSGVNAQTVFLALVVGGVLFGAGWFMSGGHLPSLPAARAESVTPASASAPTTAACDDACIARIAQAVERLTDKPQQDDEAADTAATTTQPEDTPAAAEPQDVVQSTPVDTSSEAVEDRAGTINHADGHVSANGPVACINVHFTDIPRGSDPAHPSRSPALVAEMDTMVKQTVERMCVSGYTGSLAVTNVCSQTVQGLCLSTTPIS